ncbi:hypothetical protein ACQP1W_52500 (plasmid) [Spirillospora sp. CA-255316]
MATQTAPTPLTLVKAPQARRELAKAREDVRVLRTELLVAEHRRIEMHVAYVELLAHARAAVAAAARGDLEPIAYIAGHLEEIGLMPAPDAAPDAVVAEGLAVAARLGVHP